MHVWLSTTGALLALTGTSQAKAVSAPAQSPNANVDAAIARLMEDYRRKTWLSYLVQLCRRRRGLGSCAQTEGGVMLVEHPGVALLEGAMPAYVLETLASGRETQ